MGDNTRTKSRSRFTQVLDFDTWLTQQLAVSSSEDSSCSVLRPLMKLLEYTGDGLLWLPVVFIWNIASHQMEMHHKLMNMLIVLVLDLVIVGSTKFLVRRKRPSHNKKDMLITVAVDKYSFPSGHTSRAASMALFITTFFSLSTAICTAVYVWSIIVAASRVMLGRHHVLDVLCGYIIGIGQYYLAIQYLWLSQETCERIILPIQEELHI